MLLLHTACQVLRRFQLVGHHGLVMLVWQLAAHAAALLGWMHCCRAACHNCKSEVNPRACFRAMLAGCVDCCQGGAAAAAAAAALLQRHALVDCYLQLPPVVCFTASEPLWRAAVRRISIIFLGASQAGSVLALLCPAKQLDQQSTGLYVRLMHQKASSADKQNKGFTAGFEVLSRDVLVTRCMQCLTETRPKSTVRQCVPDSLRNPAVCRHRLLLLLLLHSSAPPRP
jgi:hypothetical protein